MTGPGEALLRTILVSLDPVNRGLMGHGGSYRGSLRAGDVMAGFALAEVRDPGASGLERGALVFAETGGRSMRPSAPMSACRSRAGVRSPTR